MTIIKGSGLTTFSWFLIIAIGCDVFQQACGDSSTILQLVDRYAFFNNRSRWNLIEPKLELKYHHYDDLVNYLQSIHRTYPDITSLYSIGPSVLGRDIWVLSIGDKPLIHEPGEPEVKLVANIHGNEPIGREILLYFAHMLCLNYGRDIMTTKLLDNTQIFIMPSLNPDGFETAIEGKAYGVIGRTNSHGIDLNRNYPDQFGNTLENSLQEPETSRMMKWSKEHPFVLSASLHGGSLVASYPFDGSKNGSSYYSVAPDDATLKHLALVYSQAHNRMYNGKPPCEKSGFPNGITNGNEWYSMYGGMQDWNYLFTGCMELTLELGCNKYPVASELNNYWSENKYSLMVYVGEVHRALKGFVFDAVTKLPISKASIHVEGISFVINTTSVYGDYWRLLPTNGTFYVWASKFGYFDSSKVSVNGSQLPFVQFTNSEQLNFTLLPDASQVWSDRFDFGIVPNRLPNFLQQLSYAQLIENLLTTINTTTVGNTDDSFIDNQFDVRKFLTMHKFYITGQNFPVLIIGLSMPRHISSTNLHDKSNMIQPQFDRLRIVILAGLTADEIVSTEMSVRLLRHLVKGLNTSDSSQLPLLATSQLLIIPYMNPDGIEQTLKSIQQNSSKCNKDWDIFNSFDAVSDDVIIFDNKQLQSMLLNFQPHLVLVLQSKVQMYQDVGHIQYPIHPIYLPDDIGQDISTLELFKRLASVYMNVTKDLFRFDLCVQPKPESNSNIYKQLIRFFSLNIHQSNNVLSSNRHPIIIQLPVGCYHSCFHLIKHHLPDIWHQTLFGLNELLSAVRNLSFCGQVLIESGPLTVSATGGSSSSKSSTARNRHHKWIASEVAQLIIQPVTYYFTDSNQTQFDTLSNQTWSSIPIHKQTGRYCEIIPPGTYLILVAAGPKNSTLAKSYEDVANAISISLDHFSGRTRFYLERVLTEITFTDPQALYDRMRKYTVPTDQFTCGRLRSIGKSRLDRSIYSFELGPGSTIFPSSSSSRTNQPVNNNNGNSNTGDTDTEEVEDDFLLAFNHEQQINMSMHHYPKLVLIGNLHGHDRLTAQLLTHFIQLICDNYNYQYELRKLLHTIQISIIVIPNPDGLFKSWRQNEDKLAQFEDVRNVGLNKPFCYLPKNYSVDSSNRDLFAGYTNDAGIDLWDQLIALTGSNATHHKQWWWLSDNNLKLSKLLEPENLALIHWLREYQPNAILSFPSSTSSDITFGLDPSETSYARELFYESYNWLRHLGRLLTSGFHDSVYLCDPFLSNKQLQSIQLLGRIQDNPLRLHDILSVGHQYRNKLTENKFIRSAALALSLAAMSPEMVKNEDLLIDHSFRPPLPILAPPSLGLSLCPACVIASPNGVATVWTQFRFPSLLIGLMKHATLTAPGSSGLVGHVKNPSGDPIPWVRVHLDYMQSELSTGPPDQRGRFSLLLPPGTYRLTLRAKGYLLHSEVVTIELTKSPVHHVFVMKSVGGLSASYRLYIITIIATLTVLFSCLLTASLCYRFCCRARTPYASARRAMKTNSGNNNSGSNAGTNKSTHQQTTTSKTLKKHTKHGSYHLITLSENGKSVPCSTDNLDDDDCRKAMLENNDLQNHNSITDDEEDEENGMSDLIRGPIVGRFTQSTKPPNEVTTTTNINNNDSKHRILRKPFKRITNRLQNRHSLSNRTPETTDLLLVNSDEVTDLMDYHTGQVVDCCSTQIVNPHLQKLDIVDGDHEQQQQQKEDDLIEVELV